MADLTPSIYEELRAIARARLAGQKPGHTLQATALVNEAWMKMRDHAHLQEPNGVFFKTAAEAMRQILIDHARSKNRVKRGGGNQREPIELGEVAQLDDSADPADILTLDDAIRRPETVDAQAAEVVKLRFFAGLSVEETAQALGVSDRTVKRDWSFARAWLFEHLAEPPADPA